MKGLKGICAAMLGGALLFGGVAQAAGPIRIGAIFSVTGPASFLGEPEKNTAKMMEEEINQAGGLLGRKVELVVYDDESDATKAVTAVDRLIKKDKVVAIIGPSTSGNTLAIIPKVEEAKIPLISCAAAKKINQPVKKYVFKTAQSDAIFVKKIYQHAKKNGTTKVALLTASDAYGSAGREDLKELAGQFGITVVADEVFGPKDTDMTAQLTKIKGTPAQAIICWGTNPGPAVVARNRAQLGIKTTLYMSQGVASKKFIELAGKENAEGIFLPAGRILVEDQVEAKHPQKKVLSGYCTDFDKKCHQPVSAFGGHAYDAMKLIEMAVRNGKSADPASIRNNIEKIRGFWGVGGQYNLSAADHSGLTEDSMVMVEIVKGDWNLLK
ncbi:MAG TPA: ABC transporter substrate-binding protein [Candidatus Deferrimicrobiaceae bacterium]